MNESDRASFADAEAELESLGVAPDVLDEVETLWLNRRFTKAARMLALYGKISDKEAHKLLRRNYL